MGERQDGILGEAVAWLGLGLGLGLGWGFSSEVRGSTVNLTRNCYEVSTCFPST
jgi:hypothetical protein